MAKMTVQQFGASIKAKYPAYANQTDEEVAQAVLKKYPVYADRIGNEPAKANDGGFSGTILGGLKKAKENPINQAQANGAGDFLEQFNAQHGLTKDLYPIESQANISKGQISALASGNSVPVTPSQKKQFLEQGSQSSRLATQLNGAWGGLGTAGLSNQEIARNIQKNQEKVSAFRAGTEKVDQVSKNGIPWLENVPYVGGDIKRRSRKTVDPDRRCIVPGSTRTRRTRRRYSPRKRTRSTRT